MKWNGEPGDAKGLTHEMPFDLSVGVPAGAGVEMAASVNKVYGVADLLGTYVGRVEATNCLVCGAPFNSGDQTGLSLEA